MPKLNGKHYAYTAEGMAQYKADKKKKRKARKRRNKRPGSKK
tara:strand:+ start:128 stop:253 length:126 start_codon:yes stop_codon:yes gene_type:complete